MNIDFTLIFALLFSSSIPFFSSNLKTALKVSIFIMITALLVNTYILFKVFIGDIFSLPLQAFSHMLSLIMSEIILIIALASIIFSNSYFNFSDIVRGRIYFGLIPILSATLIGLSMSNNIISMLFFLEASTFLSAILVLYGERRDKAVFSTVIYLVMSIVESILILSGLYFLTRGYGLNLALTDIHELNKYATISKHDVELASYCILLGFGIKAGASPIALLWLPLVHSEAPSPISALLSGVIIESAYIPMLKYTYTLTPQISINIGGFLIYSGLLNILFGILGMILDKNFKRVLAFSSISNMGGLGMLLGFNSFINIQNFASPLSGLILYLVAHSLSKAFLFLYSGIHVKNFEKMSIGMIFSMIIPQFVLLTTNIFYNYMDIPTFSIVSISLLFLASICFIIPNFRVALPFSLLFASSSFFINTYFLSQLSFCQSNNYLSSSLNTIMCEIVLLIGFVSITFSIKYFDFSNEFKSRLYFSLLPILLAALMGLSSSSNIISSLIFLEASTVLSSILILYGERRDMSFSSFKVYLAMSIIESFLILVGLYLSYVNMELASYCILLGFGIKAGASPIALLWLPLVHSEAPSPISALLSGVIIESAYIPMLKYTYTLTPQISINIGGFIAFSGLINVLLGAIGMILDRDLKRILAFSSISSMGSIGMALGLGMIMDTHEAYICLLGSILYLFAHSFSKALLFLCAGIFIKTSHERNWVKISQKVRFPPITSIMWIIGVISISGLFPFTSGYYGKHLIIESINTLELNVFNISKHVYSFALYFAGIIIFCVLMGFIIFSFKGSEKSKEHFDLTFLSPFILMLISVILGILYSYVDLHNLFHQLFFGG